MLTFKIKLLKKEIIAFKTVCFHFSKPEKLQFYPGQYGKFTLIKPNKTDIKGDTRSFSITSHPSENEINIAIRLRNSAFKQSLNSLNPGIELELLAPLTMFQLPKTQKPLVFLTGGIGVAAARPMIMEALEQNWSAPIYLFNANRNLKDIPFFDEMNKFSLPSVKMKQKLNQTFSYIPVLSRKTKENKDWIGERGYINAQMLQKYLSDLTKITFYLIGPPAFMWAMYKILQELGVKESNINFDEFTGY